MTIYDPKQERGEEGHRFAFEVHAEEFRKKMTEKDKEADRLAAERQGSLFARHPGE